MKNIPGKTLILIGALITLTVVLLAVAIWAGGKNNKSAMTTAPVPVPTIVKTATISFFPSMIDLSLPTTSSATVDIITATGKNPITGAQVDVTYDPTVVTNIKLLPPDASTSLFGSVGAYTTLFSDTKTLGRATFAIAINPTGSAITGTGSVGQISFSVIRGVKPQTQINFAAGTIVTAKTTQDSVLNSTIPLIIKLQ